MPRGHISHPRSSLSGSSVVVCDARASPPSSVLHQSPLGVGKLGAVEYQPHGSVVACMSIGRGHAATSYRIHPTAIFGSSSCPIDAYRKRTRAPRETARRRSSATAGYRDASSERVKVKRREKPILRPVASPSIRRGDSPHPGASHARLYEPSLLLSILGHWMLHFAPGRLLCSRPSITYRACRVDRARGRLDLEA